MKMKHKLEYGVMILVSLLVIFALQHTIITYGVAGKVAYTDKWRSSGEVYSSNDRQMIKDLKSSIKEDQMYFFYVEENEQAEFATIASIMENHPLGFRIADAGPVKVLEVDVSATVRFMASSSSNNDSDKIYFSIETMDGESVYQYEGINESLQKITKLEPGNYFISWGVVADQSDFKLTMKVEIDQ